MSDDNVTPFRRRNEPKPPHPGEEALSLHSQRAQPGARALAAEHAAIQRQGYMAALNRQKTDKLLAIGKVVPARITMALDLRELEGPEVDIACGAAEPDVDMWELGLAVPSKEQLELLAKLTGFQVAYFYRPIKPGPLTGPVFMCGPHFEVRDPDVVDENGVLLYEGKPRKVPAKVRRKMPMPGQETLF